MLSLKKTKVEDYSTIIPDDKLFNEAEKYLVSRQDLLDLEQRYTSADVDPHAKMDVGRLMWSVIYYNRLCTLISKWKIFSFVAFLSCMAASFVCGLYIAKWWIYR